MISQPMAGLTNEQITEAKNKFLNYAEEEGLEEVNTFFKDQFMQSGAMSERGVVQIPVAFLAKAIDHMSLCHVIYFAKGWENARGCKIEHEIATQYGLEIVYE